MCTAPTVEVDHDGRHYESVEADVSGEDYRRPVEPFHVRPIMTQLGESLIFLGAPYDRWNVCLSLSISTPP